VSQFLDAAGLWVIEVLLVKDDPGDVPMTKEAFEPSPVRSMLHVVSDGEQALRFLGRTGGFTGASVSGIAFGDPVVATFLEFLLQDRECGPVGLICLAVDLHRTVVRGGERILRFLAGALQRGRQVITVTAVPTGLKHLASLYSRC